MPTRETYHHGDLRAALVSEGLRQLEQTGEGALSLRALAKAAGVSPNAPYRHFDDKHALMGALAAEGFRRFADAICEAGLTKGGALARLRQLGRAYLSFASGHPSLYRLMFSPYGYSLNSDSCQNEATRAFRCLVETSADAQSEGWCRGQDPVASVLAYWSALHGFAALRGDRLIPPEVPVVDPEAWLDAFLGSTQG